MTPEEKKQYAKDWRKKNPEYHKNYMKSYRNNDHYRAYQREIMRKKRLKNKVA